MLFALVIVALVAVVFLVLYLLGRRSAQHAQAEAQATQAALTAERDEARALAETRAGELADARARIADLESQVSKLEAEASQLSGVVRKLTGDLDGVKATSAEQAERIERQSAEIAALVADNNGLHARAEAAEQAAAEAEARNVGVVIGDVVSSPEGRPETLWALEVARSERTWRTSVATDPTVAATPFEAADDPVRLAIEVEAAALRENVGASITVDWQAAPVTDPARRHLIVRVAQEILEAAARITTPLTLSVSGDDEVTIRLEPSDAEARVALTAPATLTATAAPDVIDLTVADSGLSATVRSG